MIGGDSGTNAKDAFLDTAAKSAAAEPGTGSDFKFPATTEPSARKSTLVNSCLDNRFKNSERSMSCGPVERRLRKSHKKKATVKRAPDS